MEYATDAKLDNISTIQHAIPAALLAKPAKDRALIVPAAPVAIIWRTDHVLLAHRANSGMAAHVLCARLPVSTADRSPTASPVLPAITWMGPLADFVFLPVLTAPISIRVPHVLQATTSQNPAATPVRTPYHTAAPALPRWIALNARLAISLRVTSVTGALDAHSAAQEQSAPLAATTDSLQMAPDVLRVGGLV